MIMLKKIKPYILIYIFLGFFIFSTNLHAKIILHLHGGGVYPSESNLNNTYSTGFGFSFYLLKNFSFSFDFVDWKSDADEKIGHLYEGKLTSNLFLISGQYIFFPDNRISPYACLGTGIMFNNFEIGTYYYIPEITLSQKVEGGPVLNLGAGGLYKISDNFSLFLDLFYLIKSSTGKTVVTDMNFGSETTTFPINLNTVVVRLGLRFWLN